MQHLTKIYDGYVRCRFIAYLNFLTFLTGRELGFFGCCRKLRSSERNGHNNEEIFIGGNGNYAGAFRLGRYCERL